MDCLIGPGAFHSYIVWRMCGRVTQKTGELPGFVSVTGGPDPIRPPQPRWNGAPSQDFGSSASIQRRVSTSATECCGASSLTGARMRAAGASRSTLTAIGETAARLMGALLLANVVSKLSLAQERAFHLLIDEAHNFGDTQAIATLLQEARKFSVDCAIVSQHRAALDVKTRAALLGNIHTLLCFRIGREDAELLAPTFDREHASFNPYTLQHLERGEAMIRVGVRDAVLIDVPPPQTGRGEPNAVTKQSRLHYGVPRETVERNIMRALRAQA